MEYIYLISVLYLFVCILYLANDLIRAIYHQFKGAPYEWNSIRVLKEKRAWWKWALGIFAIIIGIYWSLPNSLVGDADFRADREKTNYTSYYKCTYDLAHFGTGTGFISVTKETDSDDWVKYTVSHLYTEEGTVLLDLFCYDEMSSYFDFWMCGWHDDNIKIGNGPIQEDDIPFLDYPITFGYPEESRDYCRTCQACGDVFYIACDKNTDHLCSDCVDK